MILLTIEPDIKACGLDCVFTAYHHDSLVPKRANRKLNAITKRNRYPLPLISELMTRLSKAKRMTKIDIRHAFNRVRMAIPNDEDLTTFRTRFGSYKSLVLPFGLTNGPATFQNFINDTFMEYLDEFVVAYLDDIFIYSNSEKEHREHVRKY